MQVLSSRQEWLRWGLLSSSRLSPARQKRSGGAADWTEKVWPQAHSAQLTLRVGAWGGKLRQPEVNHHHPSSTRKAGALLWEKEVPVPEAPSSRAVMQNSTYEERQATITENMSFPLKKLYIYIFFEQSKEKFKPREISKTMEMFW